MLRKPAFASLISVSLVACTPSEDQFRVANSNRDAVSAEVHLCDAVATLPKSNDGFSGRVEIHCEGSGAVQVQMSDGRTISCGIGYATPGAPQEWRYEIKGDECELTGVSAI